MHRIEIDGHLFSENKGVLDALILSGYNLDKELEALDKYNVRGIIVNRYYCADRINDLSFLKYHPEITKVLISNDDYNLEGLYYLENLEELAVLGKKTLDYSSFKNLKILDTRQPGPYRFPDSIQKLFLWHMKLKGKGLDSIDFPKSLLNLHILWSDIESLMGLPSGLKEFEISYTRTISSLSGLDSTSDSLEELCIENCPRLRDYSSLLSCKGVAKLIISHCGAMPDLEFVAKMRGLNHFAFPGTVVENNDLSLLKNVPSVYFTNKKGYNFKLQEFQNAD